MSKVRHLKRDPAFRKYWAHGIWKKIKPTFMCFRLLSETLSSFKKMWLVICCDSSLGCTKTNYKKKKIINKWKVLVGFLKQIKIAISNSTFQRKMAKILIIICAFFIFDISKGLKVKRRKKGIWFSCYHMWKIIFKCIISCTETGIYQKLKFRIF